LTKLVPQSVNPTKNVELTLETAKGVSDPIVIIVKAPKHQATITICRPIGNTDISKSSYIISNATDLAAVDTVNPYGPAASKAFERACIDAYVTAEGFAVRDGVLFYRDVTAPEKPIKDDYSRSEHIRFAKEQCENARREAKKAFHASEVAAGRTGQVRPDGTRAPKAKSFDDTKFKWIDFLQEMSTLEHEYVRFCKESLLLTEARAAKKATLAKYTTRIGPAADVTQKEAASLREVAPSSAPSKILRIIMEALTTAGIPEGEVAVHGVTVPAGAQTTAEFAGDEYGVRDREAATSGDEDVE
jgi:hypothetical protein